MIVSLGLGNWGVAGDPPQWIEGGPPPGSDCAGFTDAGSSGIVASDGGFALAQSCSVASALACCQ